MIRKLLLPFFALVALALLAAAPPPEQGHRGLVAANQRLASQAGADVLAVGGNAVDAAVATALAAGVVQPSSSGLGGGGFAVVVPVAGDPAVLDFRETAPAAATADMFLKVQRPDASTRGGLAIAVPGEPLGLETAQRRWGRLPWRAVVQPALKLARDGFAMGPHLAEALIHAYPIGAVLASGLFGEAEGPIRAVPGQGERVRRLRLARTLEAYARQGAVALTRGPLAEDIAGAARDAGGVLTAADLAAYTTRDRAPLVGSYRGWTIITMPPPSSGGAVLLQVLGVLEGFDLASLGSGSADLIHLEVEAFKHAYADRAHYMGDPDRRTVPLDRILSPEHIADVRRAIVPGRTFGQEYYGLPVDPGHDAGTQHISVMDADGLSVSLTTTINTSFGSGVFAPRCGVLLNDEMDDFATRPGQPNAYGLIGGEANAVAPGARPLSSMSPTVMVSPDGKRRIVIGASGGSFIISSTVQVIVNMLDLGMDPSEAVSAPRVHHQWVPDVLDVDDGISPDTIRALEARGHTVKRMTFFSAVEIVEGKPGLAIGASDPRTDGWPAGPR